MTNQKVNYTICVAVYNVENYLKDCLDSVLTQKGRDVEILLINDGSTDQSGELCELYAKKDARIKVVHKKNGGLSSVRNVGIELALGRWILFVDGDDMLLPDALEIARQYGDSGADLVNFDFCSSDGRRRENVDPRQKEHVVLSTEISSYRVGLLFEGYLGRPVVSAWGRMWNREYLKQNQYRFDQEAKRAQDVVFSFAATRSMKKIICSPQKIYWYRIHDRAISQRFSPDILAMQTTYMEHLWNDMKLHGEAQDSDYKTAYQKRCIYECWQTLNKGIIHPDCSWNEEECREWLQKLRNTEWIQRGLPDAQKLINKFSDEEQRAWELLTNGDLEKMELWCRKRRNHLRRQRQIKMVLSGSRVGKYVLQSYRSIKNSMFRK